MELFIIKVFQGNGIKQFFLPENGAMNGPCYRDVLNVFLPFAARCLIPCDPG